MDQEPNRFKNAATLLYECGFTHCQMKFRKLSHLNQHEVVHTGDRPFKCHHHGCSKEFSRPYHLKRHELFHSGIKPFRCTHEGCNVACTTKYNLKKHINKTHNKPFKCSFEGCEKECSKHKNLRSHECSHKDKLTYTCDVEGCSLSYKTPSKLKKHVMMHENGYKCKVENCNASFPKWTELLKHESFCRVIKCGKCGRILKSKENLQKHLKTHLKDRQVFKCPEDGCGRDYTKVSNLNAHLKAVHSCNTKLYVCPIAGCSSTFTYKHSLQKHLQNHDKIVKRRKKREKNTKAKECKKRQQTRIVTCEVSKLTGFVTELNDFISDEEMPETEIATDTETRKNIENRGKFICTEHPDCKMEAASRKESIPPAVQDIVDAFSVS